MSAESSMLKRPRTLFLLGLALVITGLFYWVIKGFLLALFMAAILAGLLHPFYERILKGVNGKQGLAAAVTVVLSLLLVIIPAILFLSLVVSEAGQIATSAKEWLRKHLFFRSSYIFRR